ncbi:MAG: hypothetical protein ACM3S2_19105 [Ignavibacteriales bacterium]
MKHKLFCLLVFVLGFSFYSCKKTSTSPETPQAQNTAARYYPGNAGSRFVYSYDSTGGGAVTGLPTRTTVFMGNQNIGGVDYLKQVSVLKLGPDSVVNTMFFRRTDTGVFFYVDTTGLSKFFPDSIRSQLTLQIDKEIQAFSINLDASYPWPAYKMSIKYGALLSFTIIDLTAYYQGSETLNLNLTTGQTAKKAEKIKYEFKLSIPDLSNPLTQKTRTFDAFVWYVQDVGMVKFQGNGTILGALSGNGIDFADTTRNISQNLVSYDIK